VRVDPIGRILQVRGPEPALAGAPDLGGDHEVNLLEDPDVFLHAVEGETERLGQLADRRRRGRQPLEDAAPGRIREGEERPVERRAIVH
jgi:hypothetical protein